MCLSKYMVTAKAIPAEAIPLLTEEEKEDAVEQLLEDDQITAEEAGFLQGYEDDSAL